MQSDIAASEPASYLLSAPSGPAPYLTSYFADEYRQGATADAESLRRAGYTREVDVISGEDVLKHEATGIRVWAEAVDLTQAGADSTTTQVVYHYTTQQGFASITHPGNVGAEVRASLYGRPAGGGSTLPDADYGGGVYGTSRDPAAFGHRLAVLFNNFSLRLLDFYEGHTSGDVVGLLQPCIDYCVPIIVTSTECWDCMKDQVPNMPGPGLDADGKRLEDKPRLNRFVSTLRGSERVELACILDLGRDIRVVRIEDDDGELMLRIARCNVVKVLQTRLAHQEALNGPSHRNTLEALNKLGVLLWKMGKLQDAEPLHRRALERKEEALGPTHPSTLQSLNYLAVTLKGMDKLEEAEPLFRRALACREETLGPKHRSTLISLNSLTGLLSEMGKQSEALPLQRRALKGLEETLGAKHPHTLNSLNNLGVLLHEMGIHDEAEQSFRRALQGREENLGPKHLDTLQSLSNLAVLLEETGKQEEAEPLYWRCLQGREETLGPKHLDTLQSLNNLAILLDDMGKHGEAEPLLARVLQAQVTPKSKPAT